MITDRLKRELARLKKNFQGEVYVVLEISPEEILALIVPHGARNQDVVNPLGGPELDLDALVVGGDWGAITQPMLMGIAERNLPAEPPELRLIRGDAA